MRFSRRIERETSGWLAPHDGIATRLPDVYTSTTPFSMKCGSVGAPYHAMVACVDENSSKKDKGTTKRHALDLTHTRRVKGNKNVCLPTTTAATRYMRRAPHRHRSTSN